MLLNLLPRHVQLYDNYIELILIAFFLNIRQETAKIELLINAVYCSRSSLGAITSWDVIHFFYESDRYFRAENLHVDPRTV